MTDLQMLKIEAKLKTLTDIQCDQVKNIDTKFSIKGNLSWMQNRAYGHAAEEDIIRRFLSMGVDAVKVGIKDLKGRGTTLDNLIEDDECQCPDIIVNTPGYYRLLEVKHLEVATRYVPSEGDPYWAVVMDYDLFERYLNIDREFKTNFIAVAWKLDGGLGIHSIEPSPHGVFMEDISVLNRKSCYRDKHKDNKIYFKIDDLDLLENRFGAMKFKSKKLRKY